MMIKSEAELTHAFNLVMIDVINSVAERLTEKLIDLIDEEVYSRKPDFYERTGEFIDSWEHTKPILINNIVTSEIFQDATKMHLNEFLWQHGSFFEKYSVLENHGLADIINSGKIGNICGFPQLGARPFWDKFEAYVDEYIDVIFVEECIKRGINIQHGIFYSFK